MASGTLNPSRRPHERQRHQHGHHVVEDVVHAVADEFHHLKEIEEKGDSPLTALIVLTQVALGLLVVVTVEMTVAMSFYFGWL
jgi:hypothetical protein